MKLIDVLKHKSFEGRPYRSDMELWLGVAWKVLDSREKDNLLEQLKQVQNNVKD